VFEVFEHVESCFLFVVFSLLCLRRKVRLVGWTVLPHPPYSPDLAPSDFHLFEPSKMPSVGKVLEEVKKWLRVQDSDWYRTGVHVLVSRWRKAVEVDGDYVEK
jgi:hypothetical protein